MSLYHPPLPNYLPGWPGAPAAAKPTGATPPQSTPIKSDNWASQSAFTTEQFKAAKVREILRAELLDAIFCNIPLVWDRYLHANGSVLLSSSQRIQLAQELSQSVPGWPKPPTYKDVPFITWLVQVLNDCASLAYTGRLSSILARTSGPETKSVQHYWLNTSHKVFDGLSTTHRSPDFALVSIGSTLTNVTWASIHVVGEHQSAGNNKAACILQLADYASQIFAHQVNRILVHALLTLNTAKGGVMLVVFDRAGAVVSTIMPLGVKLPDIAFAYASMSRACLGYDERGLVASGDEELSVLLPSGTRVVVNHTLCRRPGIMCRGTFCATAVPEQDTSNSSAIKPPPGSPESAAVVVKLSWRAASRQSEGELLDAATRRMVICVARHIYHCDLGDILSLRGDIEATEPALGLNGISYQPSRVGSANSSRGSRATSTRSSATGNSFSTPESLLPVMASMHIEPSAYQARMDELNRIYTLIVTTPVGIPITACTSATQIGHALLGALIGHASLCFQGGILHRDISNSNIMYTAAPFPMSTTDLALHADFLPNQTLAAAPVQLNGFLIDLDYAVPHGPREPSGAPHRTGTLPFMSIDVLSHGPHTYSDDLESFLYVLLWTCIVTDEGRVHPGSPLLDWVDGRTAQIVASKNHHMTEKWLFEELLDHFRDEFLPLRGLARRWRDVLFGEGKPGAGPGARARKGVSEVPDWDAFVRVRDACWDELQAMGAGDE